MKKYLVHEIRPNKSVLFWPDLPRNDVYKCTERAPETVLWYNLETNNPPWPAYGPDHVAHVHMETGKPCSEFNHCVCGPFSNKISTFKLVHTLQILFTDDDPLRFYSTDTKEYLERMAYNNLNGIKVVTETVSADAKHRSKIAYFKSLLGLV